MIIEKRKASEKTGIPGEPVYWKVWNYYPQELCGYSHFVPNEQ